MEKKENIVADLSLDYATRIVRFYKYLVEEKKCYVLSKQILRSGTSIGANVSESVYAQSKSDFISKMSIALKEAGETEYWLKLLYRSEIIDEAQYRSMSADVNKIIGTLIKIIKTTKGTE